MKKKGIAFLLFLLVLCPLLLSPGASSSLWWEIEVVITTDGEYKMEGGEKNYLGNYSFTILWTGTMERDNTDYILYHLNSEIVSWEAQEKAISPDSFKLLRAPDFADRPCFDLNYILRKDDDLHFDLAVQSFFVPQNDSEDKFYLNLPSSEENSQKFSEVNYNSFVSNGSNRISLEEKVIYLGPQEKIFSWTWKNARWLFKQERTVFISNSHKVKVNICIKPHY